MLDRLVRYLTKKKRFEKIVRVNNLQIDYEANQSTMAVLEAIFVNREYADYFPFYENNIIIDIGAHRGYFSLFAALNSGKESKIFSIEPVGSNFKILEQNIRQNGNGNFTTIRAAVGAFDGETDIHLSHDTNHSLVFENPLSGKSNSTEKVKAITLDSLISLYQLDKIDFLKMDCEGAEYDILFNTSDDSLRKIKVLSMEFHDLKDPHKTANSLISYLKDKNFSVAKFQYEPTNLGLNYGKLIFINQSIVTSRF